MAGDATRLWQRLPLPDSRHSQLDADDVCFFARDYIAGAGYEPPGNDRVQNFKKPVSKRGTNQWQHKLRAIEQFAEELAGLFPEDATTRDGVCTFVPPSTTADRADHDPRFDMLAYRLRKLCPWLRVEALLERRCYMMPLHAGGERSVEAQVASMQCIRLPGPPPPNVVVIDDVLTSGCTFKACKQILMATGVQRVVGVFWARTVPRF